jgi:hypothetical protein
VSQSQEHLYVGRVSQALAALVGIANESQRREDLAFWIRVELAERPGPQR